MSPLDYRSLAGSCDIIMLTLDALRYDVAITAHQTGQTPNFSTLFPDGWQERHSPGSFTYAAHAALFAGFWPTPADVDRVSAVRPFAVEGVPSRTVGRETCRLSGASVPEGLRTRGYKTVCIGGVGFFDNRTALGRHFPALFEESCWQPEFAPTSATASQRQSQAAVEAVQGTPRDQPLFLFVNYSATHPPTTLFLSGERLETVRSQASALKTIDRVLPKMLAAFAERDRRLLVFAMSDHGTTFGDDGYFGHRLGHQAVWTVPYAERLLEVAELATFAHLGLSESHEDGFDRR